MKLIVMMMNDYEFLAIFSLNQLEKPALGPGFVKTLLKMSM